MVKEIEHKGKKYFQCEICKMYYAKKELAQKCEDFCRENNACNMEIISQAVKLD